jgi:hypothetical protein
MWHKCHAIVHAAVDWNDLRYLSAIARGGTLFCSRVDPRASKERGGEPTTVSRRSAEAESALNARLFARGPDGLSLTASDLSERGAAQAALVEDRDCKPQRKKGRA